LKVEAVILPQNEIISRDHGTDVIFGHDTAWWTGIGWAWRQGEWKSQVKHLNDTVSPGQRPAARHNVPLNWLEQRLAPNRPVVSLSWFEAVAYANWLTAQLQQASDRFSLPVGYVVRLPTEQEWEKAARAGDDRRYPWGNEGWDEERANIHYSRISHANPVGMYPRGATPSGLHEMGGNVWEWTTTLRRPYPYRPDDGREDPDAGGDRVLRGGSWVNDLRLARCACRNKEVPGYFRHHLGFRVVVSPAFRNSES
jgi:formylglycine-generating enzyme required for sulfatase activity